MTYLQKPNSLVALAKRSATLIAPLWLLAACSGGGPETVQNIAPLPDPDATNYSGPPPATDEVQRFKIYFWDNLETDTRCGQCHTDNQAPRFVRDDDINLAFQEANAIVDLDSPADSAIVAKVAGGHNCWLESLQACGDTMTSYISNWAGDVGANTTQIQLTDPPIKEPGATKNFPGDSALFASTIYPVLTNCAGCHNENASSSIAPFFASNDVDTAYESARSKVNLDLPENSRFVVRLGAEFHGCWTSDCQADANAMEQAIRDFSDAIPLDSINPDFVNSRAVTLLDGIPASSGGRFESAAIATWQFKAGSGSTAFDTSGVEPALNLTLSGSYEWVGGFGINLTGGKAQGSTSNSAKLHDLIKQTNEYSVEAWVAPANVTQDGPARIISYSGGPVTRNFMLGQTLYNYDFYNRSTNSDANGEPALSTANADERLQAVLQHVVITYSPVDGRRIYVNGEYTGDQDSVEPGTLNDWDNTFALVMGAETSGEENFAGIIKFASIHNRALTEEQIVQNFDAGVGERFYLLFNVSNVISIPRAYVVFEVSQFDSYAYLFNEPFFISLEDGQAPDNIPLQGMSIGINGKEASVGQTFRALNLTLNSNDYQAGIGQSLSRMGTIVPIEKGTSSDEFFLTFEQLGDQTNVRIEAEPAPLPASADIAGQSDQGIRTFDEINYTLAQITGVSPNEVRVNEVFRSVKQALPTTASIDTFSSAQQMAITQLSIQYCDAWMEDNALRSSDFPGFDFNSNTVSGAQRDLLFRGILDKAVNTIDQPLTTQPQINAIEGELNALIDGGAGRNVGLLECPANGGNCPSGRATDVAKGVCAAVLGSAVMLIQ